MHKEKLEEFKKKCAENNWALLEVKSRKDRDEIVPKGKKHVYCLIADGNIELLGQGGRERSDLMFEGYAAPSHLKAIPVALVHNTAEDITKFVIIKDTGEAFSSQKESEACEDYLIEEFSFNKDSLKEKAGKLWDKWKEQLIREEEITPEELENPVFKVCFFFILNATGTDVGTYKKLIKDKEKDSDFANAFATIKKIVKGYYNDI